MKTGKRLTNLIKEILNKKKVVTIIANTMLISFITYTLFLCVFYIIYNNPSLYKNSNFLLTFFRSHYQKTRSIIQFNRECSQYDSDLFYKMKNGECIHTQVEFKVLYKNNSFSLREREDISGTKIVTLGDSFTIGYGVDQNQTFASIIEKITGLKTINAGISSYGTAREVLMFDRLLKTGNLSKLQYVIVQYCANDYVENKFYVDNSFNLKVGREEFYNSLLDNDDRLSNLENKLFYDIFGQPHSRLSATVPIVDLPQESYVQDDAEYERFIKILQKKILDNPLVSRQVKIVVFNVESYMGKTNFSKDVAALLKSKEYRNIADRIIVLDLSLIHISEPTRPY